LEYDDTWPEPPPSATHVVDAAIKLFASLLPVQDGSTASKTVSQIIQSARSQKLDRNIGRKTAVFINSVVALLHALEIAMIPQSKQPRDLFSNSSFCVTLADFLKVRRSTVYFEFVIKPILGRHP
jgi:HEAT repeat-containing protein 5